MFSMTFTRARLRYLFGSAVIAIGMGIAGAARLFVFFERGATEFLTCARKFGWTLVFSGLFWLLATALRDTFDKPGR